jgi:DNA-binding response OmpR family regulator
VNIVKKILIVDDHAHVRELVAATFDVDGYTVVQADSGDEALIIARAEQPDLILLDVMLSNSRLDGFGVCRQLKSDPATQNIKIAMLTARGRAADVETGMQAGADDYFTKPFSPIQLMNKVDELLG